MSRKPMARRKVGRKQRLSIERPRLTAVKVCPDSILVRLETTAVIPASGAVSMSHTFSMNSAYDPLQTHGSMQPVGFDEWMGFYEKYEVKRSMLRVTSYNNSAALNCVHVLAPSSDSSPPTNAFLAMEQPYSVYGNTSGTNGKATCVIAKSIDVRKFAGRTTASVNFTGSSTSNPPSQFYWHMFTDSADQTALIDVIHHVRIEQVILFYKRRTLGQS